MIEKNMPFSASLAVVVVALLLFVAQVTMVWVAVNAVAYGFTDWRMPWISAFGVYLLWSVLVGRLRIREDG